MVYGCDSYLLVLYLKKKTAYLRCLLVQACTFAVAVHSHNSGRRKLAPFTLHQHSQNLLSTCFSPCITQVSCDAKGKGTLSAAERGAMDDNTGVQGRAATLCPPASKAAPAAAWHLLLTSDRGAQGSSSHM